MKKKLIIIVGVIIVAAAVGFVVLKKPSVVHVTLTKDAAAGLSIYTNLDYGFSAAYPNDVWEGPVEKLDPKANIDDPAINAVFTSASTSEAIVIVAKPGDTQSTNDFAASLEGTKYEVVTVGGLPALRYEYVGPINEEATGYAKTVMFMLKGLPKGSLAIAYQKFEPTEAKAKAADTTKLNDFMGRITFTQTTDSTADTSK